MVRIKRVYDPPSKEDGFRILVDRLWPRGLTKEKAHIGIWLKDVAPSEGLRKWFSHDPERWDEFRRRYEKELSKKSHLIGKIEEYQREFSTVTLLYAAKDEIHNNAVVLRGLLGMAETPLETEA